MDRAALRDQIHVAQDAAHRVPLDGAAFCAIDRAIAAVEQTLAAGDADDSVRALVFAAAEAVRGSVPLGWFEHPAFDRDLWRIAGVAHDLEDVATCAYPKECSFHGP